MDLRCDTEPLLNLVTIPRVRLRETQGISLNLQLGCAERTWLTFV